MTTVLGLGSSGGSSGSDGGGQMGGIGGGGSSQGRGSQSALLSIRKHDKTKWPRGKDFLFSTWAFVIGKSNKSENTSINNPRGCVIP